MYVYIYIYIYIWVDVSFAPPAFEGPQRRTVYTYIYIYGFQDGLHPSAKSILLRNLEEFHLEIQGSIMVLYLRRPRVLAICRPRALASGW